MDDWVDVSSRKQIPGSRPMQDRTTEIERGSSTTRVVAKINGRTAWTADYIDHKAALRASDRFLGIKRSDVSRLIGQPIDTDDLPF